MTPAAFSTLAGATNVTQGTHGQLTLLQQDAIDVDASAGIPASRSYFDTSGVVKAQIFAATNASSGEVKYQALPTNSNVPSYASAVTTSGVLNLGLQTSQYSILSGNTTALDFAGNRYVALQVFGSDDTKLADILGLRFFNESRPEGVVFDTFSHGGYSASTFMSNTGSAGPVFAALNFQAAVIHFGSNDVGSETAAQFQADIAAIIARVRTWTANPKFPIILIADVYQQGLSATQSTQYDQYVGAELAIAQSDPNVLVINARRLMEDIGWNATSGQSAQFLLSDGIHYTALGAQKLGGSRSKCHEPRGPSRGVRQ